jgi:hypothetical protein
MGDLIERMLREGLELRHRIDGRLGLLQPTAGHLHLVTERLLALDPGINLGEGRLQLGRHVLHPVGMEVPDGHVGRQQGIGREVRLPVHRQMLDGANVLKERGPLRVGLDVRLNLPFFVYREVRV